MKVLVADDSGVVRHSLKKALSGWGYEVVEACDGKQAWQILQEEDAPRIAILDWLMPEMDGIDVCRRVKQGEAIPFTYVIMLTSRDTKEDILTGLDAGADDYLAKTVDSAILRGRLLAAGRIVKVVPPKEWTMPRVEGYDIKRLLGKGVFATVWDAVQESTGRETALKIIRVDLATEDTLRRFAREIQLMEKMDHPHIASIYDSRIDSQQGYYAMERIHGTTLEKYIKEHKPSALNQLALCAQVCEGLQHAHEQGVLHRDLKPSNIMVNDQHHAKLVDFGLGKSMFRAEAESETEHSLVGSVIGSPLFMAPEQARGENDKLDGRTDIYALGVIVYVLMVRRHPHKVSKKDRWQTIREIAEGRIRLPSELVPDFDAELEKIIMKAIADDPQDRYQSAGEFGSE
ncbi:MAG: protein kinase, partial [Planctomycetota bacterium]|nr:protein kinase [Planctomycetota bacterium]